MRRCSFIYLNIVILSISSLTELNYIIMNKMRQTAINAISVQLQNPLNSGHVVVVVVVAAAVRDFPILNHQLYLQPPRKKKMAARYLWGGMCHLRRQVSHKTKHVFQPTTLTHMHSIIDVNANRYIYISRWYLCMYMWICIIYVYIYTYIHVCINANV